MRYQISNAKGGMRGRRSVTIRDARGAERYCAGRVFQNWKLKFRNLKIQSKFGQKCDSELIFRGSEMIRPFSFSPTKALRPV